jgi:hypothetical protein
LPLPASICPQKKRAANCSAALEKRQVNKILKNWQIDLEIQTPQTNTQQQQQQQQQQQTNTPQHQQQQPHPQPTKE